MPADSPSQIDLATALRIIRLGRRRLLTTNGGDLLAEWNRSGAFTVRPPRPGDATCEPWHYQLNQHAAKHYGGQGWGRTWATTEVGDLFVYASGAFTVRRLDDVGHERYWQAHRIATAGPDDFLEALLEGQ